MRERGIHFNSEIVSAVLEGRKTQTRRIMKVQPVSPELELSWIVESTRRTEDGKFFWREPSSFVNNRRSVLFSCPFGAVGDRLWVREKTRVDLLLKNRRAHVRYEADGEYRIVPVPERIKPMADGRCMSNGCYREASRITLEIIGVRVERLNGISSYDAVREGLFKEEHNWRCNDFPLDDVAFRTSPSAEYRYSCPKQCFQGLWQSIYGEESWQANHWVWVIEFKRVEGL